MITITVTRKPLSEETVAANVLKHGCGALNIDKSRVEILSTDLAEMQGRSGASTENKVYGGSIGLPHMWDPKAEGRWPANLIHNGSAEVVAGFPVTTSNMRLPNGGKIYGRNSLNESATCDTTVRGFSDSGSAARFFYCVRTEPSV